MNIADLVAKLDALEPWESFVEVPVDDWPRLRTIVVAAQAYVDAGEPLEHWSEDSVWVCESCQVPRFSDFPGFEPMAHLEGCEWSALERAVRGEA